MPTLYSNKKYLRNIFMLRWVFEYQDGSCRCGMWNRGGVCNFTKASMQNRKNLKNIYIQAKGNLDRKLRIAAKAREDEFLGIRMISLANVPGNSYMKKVQEARIAPNIHGMMLVTTTKKIECLIDGSVIPRPNNEKKIIGAR